MAVQLIGQVFGFDPISPGTGTATFQNNAAANYMAFSFWSQTSSTLSGFRCYVQTVTGSLGANDLVATLYTDTNGSPGTSQGSSNTLSSAVSTGAWCIWTSFSGTLTLAANTRYWVVVTNVTGTPASNNITVRYGSSNTGDGLVSGTVAQAGYSFQSSTNSGTTWTTQRAGCCGWRVDAADGSFYGQPISNIATNTSRKIFNANYYGCQFTTPANCNLKVAGLALAVNSVGTPTGAFNIGLWKGQGSSVASGLSSSAGAIKTANNGWFYCYFSSSYTLLPSTTYQVLGWDANADSSSNCYQVYDYTQDSDSNSLAQFEWSMVACGSTNSGTTITTTANTITPFALLLDTTGEFAAGSSGGGGNLLGNGTLTAS